LNQGRACLSIPEPKPHHFVNAASFFDIVLPTIAPQHHMHASKAIAHQSFANLSITLETQELISIIRPNVESHQQRLGNPSDALRRGNGCLMTILPF